MGRKSSWKAPFVDLNLLKAVNKNIEINGSMSKKGIKTMSRSSFIIPLFIKKTFLVHNGKQYIPVTVADEMVGHKLGEFAPTRIYSRHNKKN